jgi:glutathione S-transferase
MTDKDVATVRKSLNDDILPTHLAQLEKIMESSTTGWIAGGEGPSIADFILVPRLQWLVEPGTNEGICPNLLTKYPLVSGLITKLLDLPAVKAYYEKNPPIAPH